MFSLKFPVRNKHYLPVARRWFECESLFFSASCCRRSRAIDRLVTNEQIMGLIASDKHSNLHRNEGFTSHDHENKRASASSSSPRLVTFFETPFNRERSPRVGEKSYIGFGAHPNLTKWWTERQKPMSARREGKDDDENWDFPLLMFNYFNLLFFTHSEDIFSRAFSAILHIKDPQPT